LLNLARRAVALLARVGHPYYKKSAVYTQNSVSCLSTKWTNT
jgi:hypothetical protein